MEFKVRLAKSAEILRAYQRDLEYKSMLNFAMVEYFECIMGYRIIQKYRGEICLLSDFVY